MVSYITSYNHRVDIRCDKEMKLYLIGLEGDHSPYIRDLIIRDRLEQGDPKLIDQEIQKLDKRIQELKELKKAKPANQDKIQELLEYHAPGFKQNAMHRTERQRFNFIEKAILPNLKKLGFKGTVEEIDNLLIDWGEK